MSTPASSLGPQLNSFVSNALGFTDPQQVAAQKTAQLRAALAKAKAMGYTGWPQGPTSVSTGGVAPNGAPQGAIPQPPVVAPSAADAALATNKDELAALNAKQLQFLTQAPVDAPVYNAPPPPAPDSKARVIGDLIGSLFKNVGPGIQEAYAQRKAREIEAQKVAADQAKDVFAGQEKQAEFKQHDRELEEGRVNAREKQLEDVQVKLEHDKDIRDQHSEQLHLAYDKLNEQRTVALKGLGIRQESVDAEAKYHQQYLDTLVKRGELSRETAMDLMQGRAQLGYARLALTEKIAKDKAEAVKTGKPITQYQQFQEHMRLASSLDGIESTYRSAFAKLAVDPMTTPEQKQAMGAQLAAQMNQALANKTDALRRAIPNYTQLTGASDVQSDIARQESGLPPVTGTAVQQAAAPTIIEDHQPQQTTPAPAGPQVIVVPQGGGDNTAVLAALANMATAFQNGQNPSAESVAKAVDTIYGPGAYEQLHAANVSDADIVKRLNHTAPAPAGAAPPGHQPAPPVTHHVNQTGQYYDPETHRVIGHPASIATTFDKDREERLKHGIASKPWVNPFDPSVDQTPVMSDEAKVAQTVYSGLKAKMPHATRQQLQMATINVLVKQKMPYQQASQVAQGLL